MDTGEIYAEALRLWRATPIGDLDNALRFGQEAQELGKEGLTEEDASWFGSAAARGDNLLLLGENLPLMAALAKQLGGGVRDPLNLVYMDPPYFSNRNLESHIKIKTPAGEKFVTIPAFSDTWSRAGVNNSFTNAIEGYLTMLTPRIVAARELLAEDGSLWIHLDRRAVHYVKVITDEIFGGGDHLINEVVWSYKSGGASTRRFSNKHDTLLFYAKDKKNYKFFPLEEKSYNRKLKPYRFKNVKEYRDDFGWYTMVNMKDVWEIPMVGRTASERTGYATQKPETLIERILLACTEEGDVCLDPFGGSGTMASACGRLGRRWISIDENPMAVDVAAERLGLRGMQG